MLRTSTDINDIPSFGSINVPDQHFEELETFCDDVRCENGIARDVSARSGEACHEPCSNRITDGDRDDGDRRCHLFRCPNCRSSPGCDHVNGNACQLGSGPGKTLQPIFPIPDLNRDIAAFDISVGLQPAAKMVSN
jgi:hypothetical protein